MKYRKDGRPDGRSLRTDYRLVHVHNWRCTEIRRALDAYPPVTLEAIGARLGITRERARQLIQKHGWTKPPAKYALTRKGGSLCRTCGQRVALIGKPAEILAAQRAHNATHVNPHHRLWETDALVAAMYLAGYRIADISREAGLGDNPAVIYHILHRVGIPPDRGNSWARMKDPVTGRLVRVQDASNGGTS